MKKIRKPVICCLDLEGVLVPEIWIQVAERTQIKELRLTTRDIPNYDVLMRRRMEILRTHGIKLELIQKVISKMNPLNGAEAFLDRLRMKYQVIILSDTFYEFAMPLIKKLGYPTLFCNKLSTDSEGFISGYHLRQPNGKQKATQALKSIGFEIRAAGDSYNDISMLKTADRGILFNPPKAIAQKYRGFKLAKTYSDLFRLLDSPSQE